MRFAHTVLKYISCVVLLSVSYIALHRFPKRLNPTPTPPSVSPRGRPSAILDSSHSEPTAKVCVVTASTSRGNRASPYKSPLATYCIPSLVKSIQPVFTYNLFVGYDMDDLHFANDTRRRELELLARPVQVRWCVVDNPSRKPGPVFNNASAQAIHEGCDYLYRVNDDSEMQTEWTGEFIKALSDMQPANVGVAGPTCMQGNTAILTHDFVHKTHHAIFGFHYPPTLTDWWLDDWITSVYGPDRTRKLPHVSVWHHLEDTRYTVTFSNKEKLHHEITLGQQQLASYLHQARSAPIHGSDRRKQVISYSLYSSDERYTDGALANAVLVSSIYPGWTMRIYHDHTVPNSILETLRLNPAVELIAVDGSRMPAKMTWRFLPIQDPAVDIFISRDIDSRLSMRERAAVAEWETSSKVFHVMRDHPSHSNFEISGGMWGFKRADSHRDLAVHMNVFIDNMQDPAAYLSDMNMLNAHIWPIMKNNGVMVHDAFSCDRTRTRPFPVDRPSASHHVGSVFLNKDSQERQVDVDILVSADATHTCPMLSSQEACRLESIYIAKQPLVYSQFQEVQSYSAVWQRSAREYANGQWASQQCLPKTAAWANNTKYNVPVSKPPWWPETLDYVQFPMLHNPGYDEGLWCRQPEFSAEIATFQCVVVDTGTVHPDAIWGLSTDAHIISHDSRQHPPPPNAEVTRISVLAVPGTIYYPSAHGHFPNEILPRLLALHERVPLSVPLLWPDTALARKILSELQYAGEFIGRTMYFHTTDRILLVDLAYVYAFADDKVYRSNFAGTPLRELRGVHAMLRRAVASTTTLASQVQPVTRIVLWMREPGTSRSISNLHQVRNSIIDFANITAYVTQDRTAPYLEQVSVLQNASVFISAHGAGMANVLFLQAGATAVEIVFSDASFRCPEEYYCLCRAIGIEYYMTAADGSYDTELHVRYPGEIREVIDMKINMRQVFTA